MKGTKFYGHRSYFQNRCHRNYRAVLNLLLKRAERDEQAMMTTLAGLIVVLLMIVRQIGNLFETIKEVFGLY